MVSYLRFSDNGKPRRRRRRRRRLDDVLTTLTHAQNVCAGKFYFRSALSMLKVPNICVNTNLVWCIRFGFHTNTLLRFTFANYQRPGVRKSDQGCDPYIFPSSIAFNQQFTLLKQNCPREINGQTKADSFVWIDNKADFLLKITSHYSILKPMANVDWQLIQSKYSHIPCTRNFQSTVSL